MHLAVATAAASILMAEPANRGIKTSAPVPGTNFSADIGKQYAKGAPLRSEASRSQPWEGIGPPAAEINPTAQSEALAPWGLAGY
jgi:hypothetical protein